MLRWAAGAVGAALIAVVLWDSLETIVIPRRVSRRLRLTRLFYLATWRPFAAAVGRLRAPNRREAYLSFYGPLSLLLLLGLWAVGLILGFGLLHYAAGSGVRLAGARGGRMVALYRSGTT